MSTTRWNEGPTARGRSRCDLPRKRVRTTGAATEAPTTRGEAGGPDGDADEEVLRLREQGRSYAAVARLVHLERAHLAHAAFVRALRRRPHDEQAGLIDRERSRLDQLEVRIRDRDRDDPTRLARRLAAVEKLRSAVS